MKEIKKYEHQLPPPINKHVWCGNNKTVQNLKALKRDLSLNVRNCVQMFWWSKTKRLIRLLSTQKSSGALHCKTVQRLHASCRNANYICDNQYPLIQMIWVLTRFSTVGSASIIRLWRVNGVSLLNFKLLRIFLHFLRWLLLGEDKWYFLAYSLIRFSDLRLWNLRGRWMHLPPAVWPLDGLRESSLLRWSTLQTPTSVHRLVKPQVTLLRNCQGL